MKSIHGYTSHRKFHAIHAEDKENIEFQEFSKIHEDNFLFSCSKIVSNVRYRYDDIATIRDVLYSFKSEIVHCYTIECYE